MLKTKILNWGHVWDLGDLYDEPRLAGIEVAIVESGVRGARMNLVTLPDESERSGDAADLGD